MRKFLYTIFLFFVFSHTYCQIRNSKHLTTDGSIYSSAVKGDTLFLGGTFSVVGKYCGGGAVFGSNSDTTLPIENKIIGDVYASTDDGNGGFYIYGSFHLENEPSSALHNRIEHILSNGKLDNSFSTTADWFWQTKMKFDANTNLLYVASNNSSGAILNGQNVNRFFTYNVITKSVDTLFPQPNDEIYKIEINNNKLYLLGSFTQVDTFTRNNIACLNIIGKQVTNWNPMLGAFSDIDFYKSKIIIGGGFNDGIFNNHACALVDSITGHDTIDYIFNSSNLYWAASVGKIAIKGDTLFTSSAGTFDTRITAIDLANSNSIIWKKHLDMGNTPNEMYVIDDKLLLAGEIWKVYKTDSSSVLESDVYATLALKKSNGDLIEWNASTGNGTVRTFSKSNNIVFVGGDFRHENCKQRNALAAIDTKADTLLSLKYDMAFGNVKCMKLVDSILYIAGDITFDNGWNTQSVGAINIKTNQIVPLPAHQLGSVNSIEVSNQYIFIGGDLQEQGGLNRTDLFAIDRSTGQLVNWTANTDGYIEHNSMCIKDNKLYVGGTFSTIAGQARNNIACFDIGTLSLTNWQPTVGKVSAIISSDYTIWVGEQTSFMTAFNISDASVADILDNSILQSGEVHSLKKYGDYIVACGNYELSNSPSNAIQLYNERLKQLEPPSTLVTNFEPVVNGNISSIERIGNNLYFGGTYLRMNNLSINPNLESYHFPNGFFNSSIQPINIQPNISGTCGFTSINFFGTGIKPKMQVKFTASGQDDIVIADSNIIYKSPNNFTAICDFSSAGVGKYNVILTDSNGIVTTITDGFEVQATSPPNLEIKIVGPSQTRIGLPTKYYLKITNNSNCDVFGIPIMLFVSGDNILSFTDTIRDINGNVLDTMIYGELNNYFEQEGKSKGYIFLINRVGANNDEYFPLNIIALSPHESCRIDASISSPILDSVSYGKRSRSIKVIKGIMSSEPFNCIYGTVENIAGFLVSDIANCAYNSYKLVLAGVFMQPTDLGYTISSLALSCTQAALTVAAPQAKLLMIGLDILDKGVNTSGLSNSFSACNKWLNPHNKRDTKNFEGRSAHDPNDKYGIGFGEPHWINNLETLSYGVHFENVDTASASAQTVRVIDTLDVNKLDVKTFKLDLLTIGNKTIDFSTRTSANQPIFYDMRPANPVILKIETILDSLTGKLEMLYTTLDTLTYLPTTDPLAGFLPPNVNKPEGEGAFYYSIKLKPNLPNDDIIKNTAHIYFDFNEPIITPTWVNTIDILPPTSKMNTIAKNTNDTTIYLSWQGNDAQSGVQKYDVMYAENGGAFQPYVSNFANHSIRFFGKAGSTYSFYTIAIDNVGNKEVKASGEVTISINQKDIIVYPNPSNGTFNVQIKNDEEVKKISLFDPLGKEVAIDYTKSNNVFKVNVPVPQHLQNYILRVQTDKNCYTSKLLIEK